MSNEKNQLVNVIMLCNTFICCVDCAQQLKVAKKPVFMLILTSSFFRLD